MIVGSVASSQSLASPSSWQKLDLLVFSLTMVTNRRGGAAGGGLVEVVEEEVVVVEALEGTAGLPVICDILTNQKGSRDVIRINQKTN